MPIAASQPFKGLYVLGALGFELTRLPIWIVKYLTSYGRQHPDWTFRQALSLRLFFSVVYHLAVTQTGAPFPLTAGQEKERWVTIEPADDNVYKGPLRSNPDVAPAKIGATWYPAALTKNSDKSNIKVIFHLHGGAFVIGSGRSKESGPFAKRLLKHATATHVVMPQYRKSSLPASKTSNPFPAGLQDSLTSYLYLVNDLKISPKDIVLSGDSAGGNLCIALLRYIKDYGEELSIPNPSACFLWSPWIDPSDPNVSFQYDNPNFHTDYLSPSFTLWGTNAYAGLAGVKAMSQPYVNQKLKSFKTQVPLWVHTGDAEVLFYDDKEWSEKMKEAGNDLTLHIEKGVPHDLLLVADQLGFQKEADNSAKKAGEWLQGKQ